VTALQLELQRETWPLKKPFGTSHGTQNDVPLLVVTVRSGGLVGRGETVGVHYLGETVDTLERQLESVRSSIERGLDREALFNFLPAGGARNAVDCALWDLEAKRLGKRAWDIAGVERHDVRTVYTIGLDTLERMRTDAAASTEKMLKVKIDHRDSIGQVEVVRSARPDARLIVDANQALSIGLLSDLVDHFAKLEVELIEQPLPAGQDGPLQGFGSPIPLCADESCQSSADLNYVASRYQFVNIKLEKAGGLTEALRMASLARSKGLRLMTGCMAATSLSMAPAYVVACLSAYVDIDGPLLLARDRENGMQYRAGQVEAPSASLWG
jgi:L-Ala-D/L-Glu epimerase